MHRCFLVAAAFFSLAFASHPCVKADIWLPTFFSDNMVLQQGKTIAVWGKAEPETEVHVLVGEQHVKTTANTAGDWKVSVPAMKANGDGVKFVVENQKDRVELENVLVGEVWFASGQSNMAWALKNTNNAKEEIDSANHPGIRMFLATNTPADVPENDIEGKWNVCSSESAGAFSAVAYYFAKKVHQETGVPIGIIKSCWGGKRCECYTSREAMLSNEHGKAMIKELDRQAAKFDIDREMKAYRDRLSQWKVKSDKIKAENKDKPKAERKRVPRRPRAPRAPYRVETNPTVLYNGMIHPFVGYTMRGAIWYQGEANCRANLAPIYQEMFTLMINDWRTRWNDDFPFYFVQLANFKKPSVNPGDESEWAMVQNQQRLTLELSGTGMATINDVGEASDIHPRDKQTVGNRLARWALKNEYGKDIVVSGPLFKSARVDGAKVVVEFEHASGLATRDDKSPQRFEVAGADKTWHWATASINGNTVVCQSAEIPNPVAVRYAWAANPEGANLVNGDGLPASIFRSDDWPAKFEK